MAAQVEREFLRLYPNEHSNLDGSKLAEAIEAFGLNAGKAGRKSNGKRSKYALLSEAIKRTSFHRDAQSLETPVRQATEREDERRARTLAWEKNRRGETWDDPKNMDENDDG